MKRHFMIVMAALATAAAGCNRGNDRNEALQTDLNLAAQANSQRSLDSISALERGYGAPAAATPRARTAPRTSTSSTARRSTSSGTFSAGTSAPATESWTTV